ncbi:uncharacterized protein LOC135337329 isoform X2 [Halichondria panicea]
MIVMYNVTCPSNHVAFFNITDMILEEPNCPVGLQQRCVDYVQVVHGENGALRRYESCGTNPREFLILEGNFQVIFRTSNNNRFPGFKAVVICMEKDAGGTGRRKRCATEDVVKTKYLPQTEEQRFLVYDLTTAFFEQPLENPEERLCDEMLNPPPFDPLNLPVNDTEDDDFNLPQCPRTTTISRTTCNYSERRLSMALANRDSPNLLVRTVVDAVLSCVHRQRNSYGDPPQCLLSREEEFPCTPRNPRNTRMPNANEIGNYTTRVQAGSSGRPRCHIRSRQHMIRPIPILGGDERIKFIFSPEIRLDLTENRQQYVLYNISCPEGHLAFFNMTNIQLKEANCFNPEQNRMVCQDYVLIIRPGSGNSTESCGNTIINQNQNQLEQGTMSILFKTSTSNILSGFKATVICFRREDADQPGCTRPRQHDSERTTLSPRRKRRNLSEFGIMPNPEEMVVIGNLTKAKSALVTEDSNTQLGEEPVCSDLLADLNLQPIPGVTTSPNCIQRQKRREKIVLISDMLEDSAIFTAIENENACNPVLRTLAEATIALVYRENPQRLAQLRKKIAANCTL